MFEFSRVSLTGDELIVEVPGGYAYRWEGLLRRAGDLLGIPFSQVYNMEVHRSSYNKILPIDERARRRALAWLTDNHNIYSLGRFATARPGLLLDALVNDIRLIAGWINEGHTYETRRHRS
jgi:hypothetical protein